MKYFILLVLAVCWVIFGKSQSTIPNGNFENWSFGRPTGWGTSDQVLALIAPNLGGVTQETNAANVYAGTKAVLLTTKTANLPTIGQQAVPGVVSLGTLALDFTTFQPKITGHAYTDRPDSVRFAVKYQSGAGGSDTGGVFVTLTRWNPVTNTRQIIANTLFRTSNTNGYVQQTLKVQYNSYYNPDTLLIQGISSANQTPVENSQMWLDDMKFIGLDTAFKAYITPRNDVNACDGDTLRFSTDNFPGDTYQWYKDGNPIADSTNHRLTVTTPGDYWVVVNHNGTVYTSDTISVVYNPVPVVTYTAPIDTVCYTTVLPLTGGNPPGGFYSGTGVSNNQFNSTTAGNGTHTITYTYINQYGCRGRATQSITVRTCVGLQKFIPDAVLRLYPQPASEFVFLETNEILLGGTLTIKDINGRILLTHHIHTNHSTIPVHSLPPGSYVIDITTHHGTLAATALLIVP
ncbi:MAG: T9SS type A sorting domain-containing protein [Chitinophagales bacterium]|nr:T9SS type A sorting domain-containing protein [Chitinophagales bacterium]MDW8420133.1 T9SS type A sorting domain-containing protein [Chitinophagales bacterium]